MRTNSGLELSKTFATYLLLQKLNPILWLHHDLGRRWPKKQVGILNHVGRSGQFAVRLE